MLLASDTFMGTVLEDADLPADQRALAMVGTVYLDEEFFEDTMTSSRPYVVRRMVEETIAGRPALLTNEDLAAKNAGKWPRHVRHLSRLDPPGARDGTR